MKRFLFRSMAFAALAATSAGIATAAPALRGEKTEPLSRMRKVDLPKRWSDPIGVTSSPKRAQMNSTPKSDGFQYLYAPDGSIWFATTQYDVETVELEGGYATEDVVKGYTFTIYDSKMTEVGTIHDEIRFEDDEYKCARVMLDVTLTQKFFNLDTNYEAMVAVCMNKPDYTVATRTLVYSIGAPKENGLDKVLMTIPGYSIDAVDTSTDPWGENFFISFLTENNPDPDGDYADYLDYLADFGQIVTTYKKAGMNPEPSVVNVHEIKNLLLPGDQMSSPMMLSKNVGGKLTLIFSQYEKSFFVDPTGMGDNDEMTPDNNLLINVYQLKSNYASELDHISTTVIPALQEEVDADVLFTFYGLGSFRYDKDVDFEHYTSDGTPAFIVTKDKYLLSDDDQYRSTYEIYNVNGEPFMTLAENTYDFTELSDVPGEEPQVMFIYKGEEQMHFESVDLYSGIIVAAIDQVQNGFILNGSVDRVPTATGYHYAMYYANGISDEIGDMYALVGWFDMDGILERVDRINVGQNVQLAQVYIEASALSPYVFNTDSDLEYMVLVKRGMGEDSSTAALTEELLIVAPGREPVRTFLPDPEKGKLSQIYLFGESEKVLLVSYYEDHKICVDGYELPFTRFQGGEGTAASPYLIATAGDLQQMSSFPNSHFRVVSDLDCGGESFTSVKDFTGSFDGGGHTIYNLHLAGSSNTALFASAFRASFKDVNFQDVRMDLSGDADAGILAGSATMCEINNVNVRNLSASGNKYYGTFGSIVGHLWTMSNLNRCAVTSADVSLPASEVLGGIAGELRTGTVINASMFQGAISGNNSVGGIVGSTTTGDETISNCRVDAYIKAKHQVGGIVGYLNRSKVKNNFVEGTLEAYEPSQWTNALSLGGIAGELHADWEGTANVPVVNNVVAISGLIYPTLDIVEKYPHQCATVHRVVGRTSYNEEPEISGENPDGTPIYKDPFKEGGIFNNLVVNSIPCVDPDFNETSVEGTSIALKDIDQAKLEEFSFTFGNNLENPWRLAEPGSLRLFFERSLYMSASAFEVKEDEEFTVVLESFDTLLNGVELTYPEDMLELVYEDRTEPEISGETRVYTFCAIKAGEAVVKATLGGETVECVIRISGLSSVAGVEDKTAVGYSDGCVTAAGCVIEIYSVAGMRLKSGIDKLDVSSLPAGAYVAVARGADGNVKTIKFRR